jgi:hypothetical protein
VRIFGLIRDPLLGPLVSAVEQVPELTADGEWEGKGASQTDALAALRVRGAQPGAVTHQRRRSVRPARR